MDLAHCYSYQPRLFENKEHYEFRDNLDFVFITDVSQCHCGLPYSALLTDHC